jgi:hypothetical protein
LDVTALLKTMPTTVARSRTEQNENSLTQQQITTRVTKNKMAQMKLEHQKRLTVNRQAKATRYIDQPTSTPSFSVLTLECATNTTAKTPVTLSTMVEKQQHSFDTDITSASRRNVTHQGKRAQGKLAQNNHVVLTCEQIEQHGSDSSRRFAGSNQQELNPSDGNLSYTTRRGTATVPGVEERMFQDIPDNQLAVAIVIDELDVEREKLVSVYATEYDPNSKPPLYKNRRFKLYGLGGCCVFLVILIVLVSLSVTNYIEWGGSGNGEITYVYQTNAPTVSSTYIPTNARENQYRNSFAEEVSSLVFEPGNPLFLASEWILNEDPQQLDFDNPRLLQR